MSEISENEKKRQAQELKNEGNEYFRKNDYSKAIQFYTDALKLVEDSVFYSNRALCYIRQENYGLAISDSSRCIEISPSFVKGYYRRGMSYMLLFNYKEGLKDFKQIVKINPREKIAKQRIKQCISEIKRIQFEKAISTDQGDPISEKIDVSKLVVSDKYDGMKLDCESGLTKEWVMDMVDRFKNQKKIHTKYVYHILKSVLDIFRKQDSLFEISLVGEDKLTVCGDTHGQYYDTLHVFEMNGFPSEDNPYLFNGDFVDRGSFSVENVLTLFAFKVLDQKGIHFTRGNHETRQLNRVYGFDGEVKTKYGETTYELFQEVFNWIPLCCLINKKVFVTHGGVGFEKDGVKLEDIKKIYRNREIPDSGLMCHLLWSDPQKANGRASSKRGVSFQFGPDVTKKFMDDNGLDLIIRSHELKPHGYEVEPDGKVVTLFSSPNYCDQGGNLGAYLQLRGNNLKPVFSTFKASPHPKVGSFVQYSI